MVRKGHYPKYSAMIDTLEELAVSCISEQQFADLLKNVEA